MANKEITGITVNVLTASASSSIELSVTTYTYYAASSGYYPLCTGTFSVAKQATEVEAIVTGTCSNATGGSNVLELGIRVQGWQSGDVVHLSGVPGVIGWVHNMTTHAETYVLGSVDGVNGSYVSIPLLYTNPTYLLPISISGL